MESISYSILKIAKIMNGERKIGGILNILIGKKSYQTIQDIHFFHLQNYAAMYSFLKSEELARKAEILLRENLLKLDEESFVKLSEKGMDYLEKLEPNYQLPENFNGLHYEWKGSANHFWERLSLVVQTVSEVVQSNTYFIPVIRSSVVQQDVKFILPKKKADFQGFCVELFNELRKALEVLHADRRMLLLQKLTSANQTGKTAHQLISFTKKDSAYTILLYKAAIHQLLNEVMNDKEQFKILFSCINSGHKASLLTNTAVITKVLFDEGLSKEAIAEERKLKISTIEDHLVEIALYDHYSDFSNYISEEKSAQIILASKKLNTHKLKEIKDNVGRDFSYFDIRLSLAIGRRREDEPPFDIKK